MNEEQYTEAESICEYVGLNLEDLIEEYEGNWDDIMSYLEDCKEQQDEMYREFERGLF